METHNKTSMCLGVIIMIISQSIWAGDLERRQAKRIHDRLTGVTMLPTSIPMAPAHLKARLPR